MRICWLGGILTLALCIAPACQSTETAADRGERKALQTVEQGMAPAEVRRVMGEPRRTVRENGEIQWMVYGSSSQRVLIYFQENEVEAIPQSPGAEAIPEL